jgi:diacylglycerol kinase
MEEVMQESIAMSMTQCFEVERMNRAIEATADPAQLQTLAKQLLHAWQSQRAATQWVIRQRQGL